MKAYEQTYSPRWAPFLSQPPVRCSRLRPVLPDSDFVFKREPSPCKTLDQRIERELAESVEEDGSAKTLLLQVFPDDILPFNINELYNFFKSERAHVNSLHYKHGCWLFLPDLISMDSVVGEKEYAFSNFLTRLGNAAVLLPSNPPGLCMARCTIAAFTIKSFQRIGNDTEQRPDLLGLDNTFLQNIRGDLQDGDRINWPNVKFILEIRTEDEIRGIYLTSLKDMRLSIARKVYFIFEHQPHRRFVPTFAMCGNHAHFSIWGRSGVVHSRRFDINEKPRLFLRAIMGLLFANDACIGFDPTVSLDESGVKYVRIGDKKYEIVRSVWNSRMVVGRATSCWIIRHEGKYYVLKESWPEEQFYPDETHFLDKVSKHGISGLPRLVMWENVHLDEYGEDSTSNIHGRCYSLRGRIHRRAIFEDFGVPIYCFNTKREPLKALKDVVSCHKELYYTAGILHCDISLNNILIREDLNKASLSNSLPKADRQGLLIDLDCALDLDISSHHFNHLVGTTTFAAAEILAKPSSVRLPRHDLESLFYVIVFICTIFPGPGKEAKKKRDCPDFVRIWSDPATSHYSLARMKIHFLRQDYASWNDNVSCHFDPYWNCLKAFMFEFKEAIRKMELTYQFLLTLIQETLDTMPLDDNSIDERLASDILVNDGDWIIVNDDTVQAENNDHHHDRLFQNANPNEDSMTTKIDSEQNNCVGKEKGVPSKSQQNPPILKKVKRVFRPAELVHNASMLRRIKAVLSMGIDIQTRARMNRSRAIREGRTLDH